MFLTWTFNDPAMILGLSLTIIVIVGGYIVFALFLLIIPGVTDKDDYILAALRIYIEIARLFFYILMILGKRK